MRGFGNYEDGRARGDGGVLEPAGDFGVVGAGHVDDDCGVGGEADAGKKLCFGGAGEGGEENVRGETAIGEGDFCSCGCAEGGGDAGDNFEIDFGFAEGLDFFGGAAEEERVTSFEADYDFVFGSVGEEERVDVLLGEEAEAGSFADVDAFGGGRT
jgi:hypothetical protein